MNKSLQNGWNELTEELFAFLDDSVVSMQDMLQKLNALRSAVIRRDQPTLEQMLDGMPEMSVLRNAMQQRQQQICQTFAVSLHCPPEKVNLSYIASFLEPAMALELKQKQRLMQDLIARLVREHHSTEMLLRECERLNRMVLDGMIGKANQTCTYGSQGRIQRQLHCSLVSTRM
jgi:hypothetical protein